VTFSVSLFPSKILFTSLNGFLQLLSVENILAGVVIYFKAVFAKADENLPPCRSHFDTLFSFMRGAVKS